MIGLTDACGCLNGRTGQNNEILVGHLLFRD